MLSKVFGSRQQRNNLIEINYCRFVGDHEFLTNRFVYVQCSYKSKKDSANDMVIQQTRDSMEHINLVAKESNSFMWQINGFFEVPIDTKITFTLMKWDGMKDKTRRELGSFTILSSYISDSHMMDYNFDLNDFESAFSSDEMIIDIEKEHAFEDLSLSISLKRHDINDSGFDIRSTRTFHKIDDMNPRYKINDGYLANLGYIDHLRRPNLNIKFPDVSDPIATLSATILQGKRLNTHYPVFITLELPGNYNQKFQSQTLFYTNTPLFDFGVDFDVYSLQSDLTILIWEDSPVSGVNLMGRVVVPLTEISDVIVHRRMNVLHVDDDAEIESNHMASRPSDTNRQSGGTNRQSSENSTLTTTTGKKGRHKSITINGDNTWTQHPSHINIPWYHDEHTTQQYEQTFKDLNLTEQQQQDKILELEKKRARLFSLDSSYDKSKGKSERGKENPVPVILHDTEDAAVLMAWYQIYPPIDPSRFNRFGQYRAAYASLQSVGYGMVRPDNPIGYLKIELSLTLNEDLASTMAHNPFSYHQKVEPKGKEEEAGLSDLIIAAQNLLRIYNLLKYSPIRVAINDIRSWKREPVVCTFAFFSMCYLALCAPVWLIPIWIFMLWVLLGWYTGKDHTFEDTAIFLNDKSVGSGRKSPQTGQKMENQQQLQQSSGQIAQTSNGTTYIGRYDDDDDDIDNKKVVTMSSSSDKNAARNKASTATTSKNANTPEDTSTESYVQKWQRMKKSAFRMQLMMNDARSSLEKINNLFMWSDPMLSSLATLAIAIGVMCMSLSLLVFQFRQGFFLFIVALFTDDVQKFIQSVILDHARYIKQILMKTEDDNDTDQIHLGLSENDCDVEHMSILWKQRDGRVRNSDDDDHDDDGDGDGDDDFSAMAGGEEGFYVSPSFYQSITFTPPTRSHHSSTITSIWSDSARSRSATLNTSGGTSMKSSMRIPKSSSRDVLAGLDLDSTHTQTRSSIFMKGRQSMVQPQPLSTAANIAMTNNHDDNDDDDDDDDDERDAYGDDTADKANSARSAFEVLSKATSFSKFFYAISALWLDMVPDDQDLQHRYICKTAMINPRIEYSQLPCKLEPANENSLGDMIFESFFKVGDALLDGVQTNETTLSILTRRGGKTLKQLVHMFEHVKNGIKIKADEEHSLKLNLRPSFIASAAKRHHHLCVTVVSFTGLDVEKKSTMGTLLKWGKQKVYVDLGMMPLGSCNYHCRSGGQPRHTQVVVREEFMFRNLKPTTECLVLAISFRAPTTKRNMDIIAGYAVVSLTDYFVAWRSEVEKVMKFASTRSNHLNYPYVVKSYPLLDKNWKPLYGNQTVQLRMNLTTELDEQK